AWPLDALLLRSQGRKVGGWLRGERRRVTGRRRQECSHLRFKARLFSRHSCPRPGWQAVEIRQQPRPKSTVDRPALSGSRWPRAAAARGGSPSRFSEVGFAGLAQTILYIPLKPVSRPSSFAGACHAHLSDVQEDPACPGARVPILQDRSVTLG